MQRRRKVVREIGRFSTNDGLHHLLSYGELLAMHLLVWSPSAVAPAGDGRRGVRAVRRRSRRTTCRTGRRTTRRRTASRATRPGRSEEVAGGQDEAGYLEDVERAEIFRAAVPRVARALANMRHLHDLRRPRGHRRLVPVAVAGARGCSPRRSGGRSSATATPPTRCARPGATTRRRSPTRARTPSRRTRSCSTPSSSVGTDGAFSHDHHRQAGAAARPHQPVIDPEVRFDYTVPGPRHLVRVIDTRSRRTYRGRLGPPKLLGNSLDTQLPPGPLTDGRELLVVVSPVPILMPHAIEALVQPLAAGIIDFIVERQAQGRGRSRRPADQRARALRRRGLGRRRGVVPRPRAPARHLPALRDPVGRRPLLVGHRARLLVRSRTRRSTRGSCSSPRRRCATARRRTSAPRSSPPASPSSCCAACPSNGWAGPAKSSITVAGRARRSRPPAAAG